MMLSLQTDDGLYDKAHAAFRRPRIVGACGRNAALAACAAFLV